MPYQGVDTWRNTWCLSRNKIVIESNVGKERVTKYTHELEDDRNNKCSCSQTPCADNGQLVVLAQLSICGSTLKCRKLGDGPKY